MVDKMRKKLAIEWDQTQKKRKRMSFQRSGKKPTIHTESSRAAELAAIAAFKRVKRLPTVGLPTQGSTYGGRPPSVMTGWRG